MGVVVHVIECDVEPQQLAFRPIPLIPASVLGNFRGIGHFSFLTLVKLTVLSDDHSFDEIDDDRRI